MDATPRRGIPLPDDGLDDVDEEAGVLPRRVAHPGPRNVDEHDAWAAEPGHADTPLAGRRATGPAEPGAAGPHDPDRLVDSVPPPRAARDKQAVLPPTASGVSAAATTGRRFAGLAPELASTPRRSATSPSQWRSPSEAAPRRSATSPSAWGEARPVPRRSATSPSAWDSPPESEVRTVLRAPSRVPTAAAAPAAPFVAAQAAEPASPGAQAAVVATPASRSWPWLVLALLLTAAVVAAWAVFFQPRQPDNPGTEQVPDVLSLLSPEQLGPLGGDWRTTADHTTLDDHSPAAKCLSGSTQRLPRAQASSLRLLGSSDGSTLLHRLDTYASRSTAIDAYAARKAQLATCDAPLHITGASEALGLGDDVTLLHVQAQDAVAMTHTVLLMRVGAGIEIVDLGRKGQEASPKELAQVAGTVVADHCERLEGTCAATAPRVIAAAPPAGTDAGFLLPADLPRITPGVGTWVATAPSPKIDLLGTGCEVTRPADVAATRKIQRTLILTNDTTAGKAFGVDSVVLSLATQADVESVAGKFNEALATCEARVPNSSVEKITAINGTSDAGPVKGHVAVVTQRPAGNAVVFRTAVVEVGTRVVYLVETPKETYGLSDAQWAAVAVRAGQRAAQVP